MTRKELFDRLNPIYPAYWVAGPEGECLAPYLVIKYGTASGSSESARGGWQEIEIMCYTPMTSILPLDEMINRVSDALADILESSNEVTPDFPDTDVKAYMRSTKFRKPMEVK